MMFENCRLHKKPVVHTRTVEFVEIIGYVICIINERQVIKMMPLDIDWWEIWLKLFGK